MQTGCNPCFRGVTDPQNGEFTEIPVAPRSATDPTWALIPLIRLSNDPVIFGDGEYLCTCSDTNKQTSGKESAISWNMGLPDGRTAFVPRPDQGMSQRIRKP